jgi:hypothetical protein
MALVWMSGVEWGTLKEFDEQNGTIRTDNPRSGAYCLRVGHTAGETKVLPQSLTEVFIQFAFYAESLNFTFFGLRKGATALVSIRTDASGRLQVCSGWGGTVYCTGVSSIQINTWYVVELHFKLDDVDGLIELRMEGNPEASFAGDTKPGADADFDALRFYGAGGYYCRFDDIVVFDPSGEVNNSWPGGLKVVLLKPNADGSVTDWTPTPAGDHYACVDEAPPAGDDYLRAESADLLEVLGLEALPVEAQAVKAVQVDFWGSKGSTMEPSRVQLGARIDETDYLSGDKDLPLGQSLISHHLDENPAGGNWSVSDVNSLQLVAKSRA